ncbi:hypothetical protein AC1031_020706 [Aphanomyces cochlioides]|nr:hypothetical protein AC1031_020706 [Aphanomyces cochlioides]
MPQADKASEENTSNGGRWSSQEHKRFLFGIKLFPNGPWKHVAAIVKTRTARQLRTHAQKYRAKLARHQQRIKWRAFKGDERPKKSPWDLVKKAKIEPIEFKNTAVHYDDCIEFLIDAFRDDLPLLR